MERPGMFGTAADTRRLEFDSKNEELLYTKKKILLDFIGDSLTHAFELGAYFQTDKGLLINRGIGGDIPFYVHKRFSADVFQLKPEYAVVLCGINETWGLDGKEGQELLTEKEQAKERILKPFDEICRESKKRGQKLVLCSLLPTYGEGAGAMMRKDLVLEINENLKEISEKEGFLYADYHQALVEEDGKTMKKELSFDGCHVNAEGYAKMAEVLKEVMRKDGIII